MVATGLVRVNALGKIKNRMALESHSASSIKELPMRAAGTLTSIMVMVITSTQSSSTKVAGIQA